MKLSELGEFGLIRRIRESLPNRSDRVKTGIGDDAAVLQQTPSELLLATADMLIEGVHFDLEFTDFYSLGWKSAAVNLSDIAAMGGRPRFCLTSLGIPRSCTVKQIMEFYRGCTAVLRAHGATLVGGDTCSSTDGFVVSVTLLGETESGRGIPRSGAKAGDRIFVTGPLGDSAAGLELLQSGIRTTQKAARVIVDKHLRPEPRVSWGRKLARAGVASAMIDISDGLSSDLKHICEESRVGAVITTDAIPLSPELCRVSTRLKRETLWYALHGGEDYELLITAPSSYVTTLRALGIPLHEIGVITRGRSCFLRNTEGRKTPLLPGGYDHFRTGERGRGTVNPLSSKR